MNTTTYKTTIKTDNSTTLSVKSAVITKQQVQILARIYNFRFVSTFQLQQVLAKEQIQQVQQRLNLLLSRGYIGRNFSKLDRLTGKFASYYLLPDRVKVLKQHRSKLDNGLGLNPRVLHNIYKDKTASARFINHCLAVGDINCHLCRLYGDDLEYFSKSKLAILDYFPEPHPDAFLRLHKTKEYFLEYCEEIVPFFVYRKRIKQYVEEYLDEGIWEDVTKKPKSPDIMLVAETPVLQRRLRRFLKKYLNDLYMGTHARFLITNMELLKSSAEQTIWTQEIQEE
jgi:hypothetical protein